ncbi:MAG: TolB family protein [Acidobacteriota bacterium]
MRPPPARMLTVLLPALIPGLAGCAPGAGRPAPGLLIVSDRGGAMRIYERAASGPAARLIGSDDASDPSYRDAMPARLADGRVVFVSDRRGVPEIFVADPGAGTAGPLFPDRLAPGPRAPASAPGPRVADSDPAPLGRNRIVFARTDPDAPGATRDLYLVGLDGTGLRRLTAGPGDEGAPAGSPDGRSVAFVADRGDGKRLALLRHLGARGLSAAALDLSAAAPPDPGFVPPGTAYSDAAPAFLSERAIVFARSPAGRPAQLFVLSLDRDRVGLRQITDRRTAPFGASEPVLLAGVAIAFTAGPAPPPEGSGAPERYAVYRVAAGGFNLSRITRRRAQYNDFTRRLVDP